MKIIVNCSKIDSVANSIENCISVQNKQFARINSQIISLKNYSWNGKDFDDFLIKWNKLKEKDSHRGLIENNLNSVEKSLRYASAIYKTAQSNAIQRSKRIPL